VYLQYVSLQIPLIELGRSKIIRNHPMLGNFFFWFGLMIGPPMLCVLYATEYCSVPGRC
jgi:sterol O-acyltransferase